MPWHARRPTCYHRAVSPPAREHPSGLALDDLPSDAGDDAPLVVLVHGTLDRSTSFARIRSRLMATCRVVSYDRRGYGASRHAEPPARHMADHVDDLELVVDARPCTLLGHSYGGDVVLSFAERHPDFARAVVAYEPPLPWLQSWPRHSNEARHGQEPQPTSAEAAETFLRRTIGDHRFERLPLRSREEALRDGDALVAEMAAIRRDPAPFDPARISCPVLVAAGSETAPYHRDGAVWLAGALPGASLHVLEGAGHLGHLTHAAEVTRLVQAAVDLGTDPTATRPPDRL